MRIFNWVHRKFRQNPHDYDYGVKDSSDGLWPRILQDKTPYSENSLDEKAKRIRISEEEDKVKGCSKKDMNEDTEALLPPRDSTVTELFSNWQNGLLTIGTFGIDQNEHKYGYDSMDNVEDFVFKETDDEEDLIDPIEVKVLEGKLGELFGLKNEEEHHVESVKPQQWQNKGLPAEAKGFVIEYPTSDLNKESSRSDDSTDNNNNQQGNKVYPLQEFFEVPLLDGTGTKKERRTTLAELFSRSKNYTSSHMLDDAPKLEFESDAEKDKKKAEILGKSGRSLVKKVLKWKKGGKELHRSKQWMMKMLNKKIYPEAAADLHANEVMGHLDVSKTFLNASKLKELNTHNCSMDGKASLTNRAGELISLLRDTSQGSQECWIKTDSEYVVLEL